MGSAATRKTASLAVPLGMAALAWLLYLNLDILPPSFIAGLEYVPYFVFFTGFLLSCRFNRSGILFIMVILLLVFLWQLHSMPNPGVTPAPDAVYIFICLLLPANILLFAFLKERGILTSAGRLRGALILLQLFLIAVLAGPDGENMAVLPAANIVPPDLSIATPVPQPALLVFAFAFASLADGHFSGRLPMAGLHIGVLITVFAALYYWDGPSSGPVFFSAAAIILLTGLVQDSYSKAYLDDLTGLPGRRSLREDLLKLGDEYTIAMVDIDNFKKFNDRYGHDVGDQVLKFVASIIKTVGNSKAYRYGGEEFTILFPGKTKDEVLPQLEELRKSISQKAFILRGKDRPAKKPAQVKPGRKTAKRTFITVSIGVAEKSKRYTTPEEVLKAADTLLYRAKNKGRNQVC